MRWTLTRGSVCLRPRRSLVFVWLLLLLLWCGFVWPVASTTMTTATTETTCDDKADPAQGNKEPSLRDVRQILNQKLGDDAADGTNQSQSVWSKTMETLHMADGGSSQRGDVIVRQQNSDDNTNTMEQALGVLQDLLEEDAATQAQWQQWSVSLLPVLHDGLGLTTDKLLRAFVAWSKKDDTHSSSFTSKRLSNDEASTYYYNVSKAFRRLQAYLTWMADNQGDLVVFDAGELQQAHDCWQMQVSHDAHGRLVWWMDLGALDVDGICRRLDLAVSLRYMVWQAHVILLDARAQDHGMVFCQSLAHRGLWQYATMLPMEFNTKLDRLTVGVLPIKMKHMYLVHSASWVHVVATLTRPFFTKKMRQRVQVIRDRDDPQKVLEEALGCTDCLPPTFSESIHGSVALEDWVDLVAASWQDGLSSAAAKEADDVPADDPSLVAAAS